VEAFARVGVLVQRGAVEARQAMVVAGEMRRHPVQQQAQALRVAGRDEARQPIARAEARARRVHAQRLVAPGTIEGMLGNRHSSMWVKPSEAA
jgi:hypothetical protein